MFAAGISSWGRKVGRRLEQLSISDNETLTYNVNPVTSRSENTLIIKGKGVMGGITD